MVEESGDAAGFDAREWLMRWLEKPLPALGGQRPVELLSSKDGLGVLSTLLARARAGAYS
ncbi:MAG: MbcA/ParS/Xre antitoxin family protein [Hylemonella sp.]|nr:MbcA/ParS/Xre antitoxin family protein [Hylemonella sp.]MDP1936683.1 MbcA/ParS/Xre antitoxin family protein [Hylemonella sp.]